MGDERCRLSDSGKRACPQESDKMYRQLDLNSYQLEPAQCKRCGSCAIVRNGFYRGTRKQVYRCKRCNCRFVYNYSDLEKMRFHSKIIAFAVELYTTTGISLRTLARKM